MPSDLTTSLQNRRAAQEAGLAAKGRTLIEVVQDERIQKQIFVGLARGIDLERFVRLTITELRMNPSLLACTEQSFLGALMDCAALGLYPLRTLGHVYLVPFNNKKTGQKEIQLIIGWKGEIVLGKRSEEVADVTAEVVHERDDFSFEFGTARKLLHKPALVDDPGPAVAVYAVAYMRDGTVTFKVLSKAQVESYRARSQSWRNDKEHSPWTTDTEAMWRKTAVHRLADYLPLEPEIADALKRDEGREYGFQPVEVDLPSLTQAAGEGASGSVVPAPDSAAPSPASAAEGATPGQRGRKPRGGRQEKVAAPPATSHTPEVMPSPEESGAAREAPADSPSRPAGGGPDTSVVRASQPPPPAYIPPPRHGDTKTMNGVEWAFVDPPGEWRPQSGEGGRLPLDN